MWGCNILNARVLGVGFALVGVLAAAGLASAQVRRPSSGAEPPVVRIALAKELPRDVTRTPELNAIVGQFRSGKKDLALAGWKAFVKANRSSGGKKAGLHKAALWILRKSYVETNEDLKDAADRVQFFDELRKALRREIVSARRDLAKAKSGPLARRMVKFRTAYAAGLGPVETTETRTITEADLQTYLHDIASQQESASNERGLAANQVEADSQQQNQMWTQIASILKEMDDMVEAPLRNML